MERVRLKTEVNTLDFLTLKPIACFEDFQRSCNQMIFNLIRFSSRLDNMMRWKLWSTRFWPTSCSTVQITNRSLKHTLDSTACFYFIEFIKILNMKRNRNRKFKWRPETGGWRPPGSRRVLLSDGTQRRWEGLDQNLWRFHLRSTEGPGGDRRGLVRVQGRVPIPVLVLLSLST